MSFSYLKYINNPTPANVKLVHKQANINMTVTEIAKIIDISPSTYEGWLVPPGSIRHRKPPFPAWNLLLYELEARRLNFLSIETILKDLRQTTKKHENHSQHHQ